MVDALLAHGPVEIVDPKTQRDLREPLPEHIAQIRSRYPNEPYRAILALLAGGARALRVAARSEVARMVREIDHWKDAPLWDQESIAVATKTWFRYMGDKS